MALYSTSATATSSLASTSALRATSAHVWHVADVNTATSHGASGRVKSARSSCAGTVRPGCVGGSEPPAAGDQRDGHGDGDDRQGDQQPAH